MINKLITKLAVFILTFGEKSHQLTDEEVDELEAALDGEK